MSVGIDESKRVAPESITLTLKAIEQRLDYWLPLSSEREKVSMAMRQGTLAPGKRIRPLLLLLMAQDLGGGSSTTGMLDFACAVEIIHAASLILDDMPCMDNALLRRNQPTIHCQFGEPVALLAVIALVSKAFQIISQAEGIDEKAKNSAVSELAQAIGLQGLVQGQYQDINEGHQPRSQEAIALTNHYKTSTLFCAALQMAAIATGATMTVREHLRHCSFNLGQAFQLLDDLSDGSNETGKDPHQDAGKSTWVNVFGTRKSEKQLREHLDVAYHYFAQACRHRQSTQYFVQQWFEQKLAMII
ncbi:polyprenyl synthetase family protein [Rosenbergiella australiborealis]|uniref:Polyprenyl synthetase family protein n=1 Tax=Rosenbergiella australiborealis TaxID=1544696 RepID=A0ABS5T479_9GAMM|nr:polyprenyl synthetase family protein [Rosenbergiella australiborealis]MBT0727165.1 polyprenyl synthetase family protein [Rosenbergiella australiborealis]